MIIAVDGPTASGKNTTCALLAKKLGILYINSGSYYRAVAFTVLDIPRKDRRAYLTMRFPNISLQEVDGLVHFFFEKQDITASLHDHTVSKAVSEIASLMIVRERATKAMQQFARGKSIISDGRDATTVIFPDADFKIYLDAPLEVRAARRYQDVIAQGKDITLAEITRDIETRDNNDQETSGFDPKDIHGMHIIDSSTGTPEEVSEKIYTLITQHD